MPVHCTCGQCGCAFTTFPAEIRKGGGKFCSISCRGLSKRVPMADKFWANILKTDGCWVWVGALNHSGYGSISLPKPHKSHHAMLAHRFSWEMAHGSIPNGLDICHHCDNPPCVRLDHLFIGTRKDNMQDALLKGRIWKAKITPPVVQRIRQRFAAGDISQAQLARDFGMSPADINHIVRRRIWQHVPDLPTDPIQFLLPL